MAEYPIIPEKTALLFFDTLNTSLHPTDPAAQAAVEARGIIPILQKANQEFRKVGIRVFYAQADHRPDRKDFVQLVVGQINPEGQPLLRLPPQVAGSWAVRIIPEIEPQPEDYVIKKHRWSAFYQTHLELSLRTAGIDTILLAGGAVGVGVASTAYSARDRDFTLIILRDACYGGSETGIRALMDEVFASLARVMTVDQALALVQR